MNKIGNHPSANTKYVYFPEKKGISWSKIALYICALGGIIAANLALKPDVYDPSSKLGAFVGIGDALIGIFLIKKIADEVIASKEMVLRLGIAEDSAGNENSLDQNSIDLNYLDASFDGSIDENQASPFPSKFEEGSPLNYDS